jgi:hypothetical protein
MNKIASGLVNTLRERIQRVTELLQVSPSTRSEFGIAPGYRHRRMTRYFDDTTLSDEWQKEVYEAAAAIMKREGLHTVCDVGCGSGYKLVHYLGSYQTLGLDVEPTLTFLRAKYPDRDWRFVPFDSRSLPPADLVISSDVIEHVLDPDALLDFLAHLAGRYLVLSTPERNLVYPEGHWNRGGPPRNRTHMREWSFDEFRQYVGSRFDILEHRITNREQATQMIVCRVRRAGSS